MKGYPITLVGLDHTRCAVIGGGEIAARRVSALQAAGARPVIISPMLCDALRRQVQVGELDLIQRAYQPGDLAGMQLVIAATDDPEVNEAVWREAQIVGCLINVVDDLARCTFHVPATVRRGDLTLSISTGGSSPGLARRLRQALEQQFDGAYEPYVALLGELRPLVQARIADARQRRALWEALLDSDILDLLRSGTPQLARERAEQLVSTYAGDAGPR